MLRIHGSYDEVFERVCDLVFNQRRNIFIHAPGGTGKTHMVNKLFEKALAMGHVFNKTALTGIAAIQIGGVTLHNFSGIHNPNTSAENACSQARKKPAVIHRWKYTDFLSIDEVSMLSESLLNTVDFIAKKVRKSKKAMGGLTVIMSGDFFQLPPVKEKFCFHSPVWKEMDIVEVSLETPKRYTDMAYYQLLLRVRKGQQTEDDIEMLHSRQVAFSELREGKFENGLAPPRLFAVNRLVDAYNNEKIKDLKGEGRLFGCEDKVFDMIGENIYIPVPNITTPHLKILDALAPEVVRLKIGSQVMITKNISVESGIVNGRQAIVKGFGKGMVHLILDDKREYTVEKEDFSYTSAGKKYSRFQIPLSLSWALSIHKCQGTTLETAVGDLGDTIFEDGQAYVMLSRVRSLAGLYLINFAPEKIKPNRDALLYEESTTLSAQ
jgi:ATP-dependent DNA helicase PIF1